MLNVKNTSSRKGGIGRVIMPSNTSTISGTPRLPRLRLTRLPRMFVNRVRSTRFPHSSNQFFDAHHKCAGVIARSRPTRRAGEGKIARFAGRSARHGLTAGMAPLAHNRNEVFRAQKSSRLKPLLRGAMDQRVGRSGFSRDAFCVGYESALAQHHAADGIAGTEGAQHAYRASGKIVLVPVEGDDRTCRDRKSTRLDSSHVRISDAVFCLNKEACSN